MFNKKRYFKKKLNGVQCMIWDLEFKRAKTLQIREDIRNEYDGIQARLQVLETHIKSLPEDKTKWTDEQKRLEDQKVLLERDRDRFTEQMKGLDLDVHGAKKSNEYPDGADGIDQQLDALRELHGMIKQFIKTI